MRSALFGIVVSMLLTAPAVGQPPGEGNFNQGGRGPGGPAGPGVMGPPPNAMFSAIDTDGDGVITKAELRKAVAALRKLDTDGDGNITLAEVQAAGGPMGDPAQFVERMMQNDLNGDGLLTADELQGPMAQRLLQQADQNGDGALDRNELTAAMQNMPNQFPGGAARPGVQQGQQGGLQGGQRGGALDPQQETMRMIQQYDRNGDGKLSPDEIPQDARQMLGGADLDGDGFLSPEELRIVNEQMRQRMRGAQGRGFRGRAGQNDANRGGPQGQPRNP